MTIAEAGRDYNVYLPLFEDRLFEWLTRLDNLAEENPERFYDFLQRSDYVRRDGLVMYNQTAFQQAVRTEERITGINTNPGLFSWLDDKIRPVHAGIVELTDSRRESRKHHRGAHMIHMRLLSPLWDFPVDTELTLAEQVKTWRDMLEDTGLSGLPQVDLDTQYIDRNDYRTLTASAQIMPLGVPVG